MRPDTSFVFFAASIVSMSASWDSFTQNYAIVVSLILVDIFIAELIGNGSRIRVYSILLFCDLFFLAAVGGFILPATGKWATGLHWHALLTTLLIITIVFLAAIFQWFNYRSQQQHNKDLVDFEAWFQYVELAKKENKRLKDRLAERYKILFLCIVAVFLLAEATLIYVVWRYQ